MAGSSAGRMRVVHPPRTSSSVPRDVHHEAGRIAMAPPSCCRRGHGIGGLAAVLTLSSPWRHLVARQGGVQPPQLVLKHDRGVGPLGMAVRCAPCCCVCLDGTLTRTGRPSSPPCLGWHTLCMEEDRGGIAPPAGWWWQGRRSRLWVRGWRRWEHWERGPYAMRGVAGGAARCEACRPGLLETALSGLSA